MSKTYQPSELNHTIQNGIKLSIIFTCGNLVTNQWICIIIITIFYSARTMVVYLTSKTMITLKL